jgi:hypothetical protein
MVAIGAGGGMSHEEMAIGLGIDRNTLEKHYARELSEGAYLRRAEVVAALHSAALKGNASAAREYLSRTPQVSVPPAPTEGEAKKSKLGKKEQAEQDAKTATRGTDWGDVLPRHGSVQ